MAVWASRKGCPGMSSAIAQDLEGVSLAGYTDRPSSLRRNHFSPWAGGPIVRASQRTGSRDRRVSRRQPLGGPRRRRRRRSHPSRSGRPTRDRRWRAAWRDRDDSGSSGNDLGCDASRAVQVSQRPLEPAGRKGRRATAAPRRSASTKIAPDICGSGRRRASISGRRTPSSWWTRARPNVQSLTEDASGDLGDRLARRCSSGSRRIARRSTSARFGSYRRVAADARQSRSDLGRGVRRRAHARPGSARCVGHHRALRVRHRLAGSPRSLFEDREGNIWVGMRGGLIRLSESSFTSVAQLEGLTNDGVRTATVGSDGSVWVATGHALNRFSSSGRTSYSVSQTMALHSDRRGTLWVSAAQQDRSIRRRPIRARSRSRTCPAQPRDGAHDGLRRHAVALHGAQGRDDLGRQSRVAIRWARSRARRSRLPVDLHRTARDASGSGCFGGGAAVYEGSRSQLRHQRGTPAVALCWRSSKMRRRGGSGSPRPPA